MARVETVTPSTPPREPSFEEALKSLNHEHAKAVECPFTNKGFGPALGEVRAAHARELAAARAETWREALEVLADYWPTSLSGAKTLRVAFEQRAAAAEKER